MLGAALQRPRGPAGICLVPQAGAGYSTNFPATENPISESGRWTNATVFAGGDKTAIQTAGKAYATMVAFDGTHFNDSSACLSGFGPDHQVTCTISNSGGFSGFSLELEILLRATINSSGISTYEVDCVFGGPRIDLVRWDNTIASPDAFTSLRNGVSNEVPLANGDQVRAKVKGTLITVDYKLSGGSFTNLFTYETASDGTKYSTGNPGIGAWNQTGLTADQPLFAWADFAAVTL